MDTLEKSAKKFLKDRGWDKLRPADLAKSISIEAGELLELFQWSNQELEKVKADKAKIKQIEKELADVLLFSIYMSISLGLDTEKVILNKLKKVSKKYPPSIMKNKGGEEPGTEAAYHKIKKSY